MQPSRALPSEDHYTQRSNWLRAAVLGANDGLLSTASLAVGVAAASATAAPVLLATFAGLVAGTISMAAGEYVSVSSQRDLERADTARERAELAADPEGELRELADTFVARGLDASTARAVAEQLSRRDALGAHLREELGLHELTAVNPLQAAVASGAMFILGGALPLAVVAIAPFRLVVGAVYACTIVTLMALGAASAKTGGASVWRAVVRITVWGTIAMATTTALGYAFDTSVL